MSAGVDGPDGDTHAGLEAGRITIPQLEDHGRRLMPLDPRIHRRQIVDRADVTEEVVEVGAAQANRLRSKEHLAGAG